jgi:glyoxylase-like metal-dependent hydrolase (beta-lactamase superfamily II)
MTACADELQAVSDSLFWWSVYDPAIKCELGSIAVKVASGLIVVDPIPLADEAWAELLAVSPLRAILLTNGNHVRDAEALRARHQVPIVTAPATHKAVAPLVPDVTLLEKERVYGASAIPIPGATAGETAFHFESGVLALGDAVLNLDSEKGLELLPDKYCDDPRENRRSLEKLLALDFHTLTFAHGQPVTQRAKDKLRALLQS